LRQIEYNPCLALLVQLDGPSRVPPPGGLQFSEGPISWIADNQLKGISPRAVTLTIHASPSYSRDRYGAGEEEVSKDLLRAASEWIGDSKVVLARLHRWRYSHPAAVYPERSLMAHDDPPLVFAGDAFGGPRIEGAALSGMAAAQTLLNRLHSIV
jgi:predicted NAD/FAD-dependent oxidoreductase